MGFKMVTNGRYDITSSATAVNDTENGIVNVTLVNTDETTLLIGNVRYVLTLTFEAADTANGKLSNTANLYVTLKSDGGSGGGQDEPGEPDATDKTTVDTAVYTVTFVGNRGTFAGAADTAVRTVTALKTAVGSDMPAIPVRSGYDFKYFNTETNGFGAIFTSETKVTGDITVYAQWTANARDEKTEEEVVVKKPEKDKEKVEKKDSKSSNSAALKGWISGYPDGTFMPESFLTRAEIVSVINRVMFRGIEVEDIPAWAPRFNDLKKSHWSYTNIIEASVGHDFERKDNVYELWMTKLND